MRKPTAKECRQRLLRELREQIAELLKLRRAGHRFGQSWEREEYQSAMGAVRALMHACSQCGAISHAQFDSVNHFVHSVPLTFVMQRRAKAGAA